MIPVAVSSFHLENWFSTDAKLDQLYPKSVQSLASMHWSPLSIAHKTASYLAANDGEKVLDIGSGVGKFCLAGAYYKPSAFFYGVEQRKDLVEHAETVRNILGLQNVYFIHRNFTQLDLQLYDHFYFYNAFFENLDGTGKIDNEIVYSNDLYNYYSNYLFKQLEKLRVGTRIVTYCSWCDEIPPCYQLVEAHFNNLLKFWVKV